MTLKISDLMDGIQDDTVRLREKNDIASARVMEVTMKKLNAMQGKNSASGRRLGKGAIIAIAAAACLALSGVAAASEWASQTLNWQGEEIGEGALPMETDEPVSQEDAAQYMLIAEILEARTDRELVIVQYKYGSQSATRTEAVASLDELAALLEREDSPLGLPFTVPEGYELTEGTVTYDSAAGYGYTLESAETVEYDMVVERYSAPAEGDFISAYALEYQNEEGEQFSIICQMNPDMEYSIGAAEGAIITTPSIDGMDDALLVGYSSSSALYMRQLLAEPVSYVSIFSLGDDNFDELEEYTSVCYSLYATGLDAGALLALTG